MTKNQMIRCPECNEWVDMNVPCPCNEEIAGYDVGGATSTTIAETIESGIDSVKYVGGFLSQADNLLEAFLGDEEEDSDDE